MEEGTWEQQTFPGELEDESKPGAVSAPEC
jgi:hypothetical protein